MLRCIGVLSSATIVSGYCREIVPTNEKGKHGYRRGNYLQDLFLGLVAIKRCHNLARLGWRFGGDYHCRVFVVNRGKNVGINSSKGIEMTTSTNTFADALDEAARTSHDESVASTLKIVAGVVREIGLSTLQGPAGPQGEQGATGAQGPSGAPGPAATSQVAHQ